MKEYKALSSDLGPYGQRVFDASEFLHQSGLVELLQKSKGVNQMVTYHDACHLAHGQGIRTQPRELLSAIPGIQLVEMNEPEMCCGSAGIYNIQQPVMAKHLLDRKWENVRSTGAKIVVSGNPGCHAWLEQASQDSGQTIRVVHTMELLEASFSGLDLLK
jgi:glycolate oxidase iron-sulfur subunit